MKEGNILLLKMHTCLDASECLVKYKCSLKGNGSFILGCGNEANENSGDD